MTRNLQIDQWLLSHWLRSLSPKSDQNQFSPNDINKNINTKSREKFMRIK